MKETYKSDSPEKTAAIAKKLAKTAAAGDIFCLTGELGAGKTVFAKGFAAGLGIKQVVTSPTFVLVNQYDGRLTLYHFDVYRISAAETDEIGFGDYLNSNGVCLIEWADNIKSEIPQSAVWVNIKQDGDARIVTVERG